MTVYAVLVALCTAAGALAFSGAAQATFVKCITAARPVLKIPVRREGRWLLLSIEGDTQGAPKAWSPTDRHVLRAGRAVTDTRRIKPSV
jgi:hypothetical protein